MVVLCQDGGVMVLCHNGVVVVLCHDGVVSQWCRFGESAELLHSFDQPFSAPAGAHVLQHLSFSQTRTNFVEVNI